MDLTLRNFVKMSVVAAASLVSSVALSGCLVAGVSSGGGFFIWPGSVGLLLLIVLILFLLRRR